MARSFWLMKSEPFKYSWDQLVKDRETYWDGVRNYEARNNLAAMHKGDLVLYYHSNEGKEVVGVARVTREAYPDPTTKDDGWVVVDVAPLVALAEPVSLAAMKAEPALAEMALLRRSRLSVVPVKKREFDRVLRMGKTKLPGRGLSPAVSDTSGSDASDSRREIEKLIFGYAERVDAGDFEGLAELFADGGIRAPGAPGAVRGRPAVLEMYERTTRRYDDGTPHTQHLTTNLVVELDEAGESATAHSRFTVLQALPDFPLQPIIAGRYRDRFERVDGRWRFLEREIVPELYGDLSRHLLVEVPR